MSDARGLDEGYKRSSPWPIFVAFGLALSEVGVIVPLFPVAVGGLLLFTGSLAGILRESDTVEDAWLTFGTFGGVLVALGVGLYLYTGAPTTVEQITVTMEVGSTPSGGSVAYRALAIVTAGLFALGGAIVGRVMAVPDPTAS
jgi:hypothetical protein